MMIFLLISFPSCDLNRELAFAIPPVTAQAMPPCSRIAHVFLADDIAIPDCDYCYSTHFPRPFIAVQRFAPATNTLLNFSLADRRSSQPIYGQSRHSITTALLDFSSQIIAQTLLFFASPSLIFATLALANPHNALLVQIFALLRFGVT